MIPSSVCLQWQPDQSGSSRTRRDRRSATPRLGTRSSDAGAWDWKAAHDACESATVLFLCKFGPAICAQTASPAGALKMLGKVAAVAHELGRLIRDIRRKIKGHGPVEAAFESPPSCLAAGVGPQAHRGWRLNF